jgi:hypothetical protein
MRKVNQLAAGQITAIDTLIIELVEADETPAVVIIRWPSKPTILHPRRFPDAAGSSSGCLPRRTQCWPGSKRTGGCSRAGRRQGLQDFTSPPPGRPAFANLRTRRPGRPGVQVQGLNISATARADMCTVDPTELRNGNQGIARRRWGQCEQAWPSWGTNAGCVESAFEYA